MKICDLGHNSITHKGAGILGKFLIMNTSLSTLNLGIVLYIIDHNFLGDGDLTDFINGIKQSVVSTLNLS